MTEQQLPFETKSQEQAILARTGRPRLATEYTATTLATQNVTKKAVIKAWLILILVVVSISAVRMPEIQPYEK